MFSVIKDSFTEPINLIIIISFILTLIALLSRVKDMKKVESEINSASRMMVKTEPKINRTTGAVETETVQSVDIHVMDEPRKKYNECGSRYVSWVQIISLFPLLGLFGTILGLIPGLSALSSSGDISELYNSLSVALSSTFFGIIASIILKIVVSFYGDKEVNRIEGELTEYDRQLELLSKFKQYTE